MEAILNGTWEEPPPIRHPVILSTDDDDGPLTSVELLQELAETESVPEVIDTTQVDIDGKVARGTVEGVLVMFQGKRRWADTVKAMKKGVTLGAKGKNAA
ncbi:hypothetical protein VTH06DRAFT_4936 [Thermothelomyces fergusii]